MKKKRLVQDSVYSLGITLRLAQIKLQNLLFFLFSHILSISAKSEWERTKRPFTLFKAAFHFPVRSKDPSSLSIPPPVYILILFVCFCDSKLSTLVTALCACPILFSNPPQISDLS
uniref:Uncharacterized protein n=1 Tax=Salix viminalis TaxID=40686 RepID=A0A6N2L1P0_SALVM